MLGHCFRFWETYLGAKKTLKNSFLYETSTKKVSGNRRMREDTNFKSGSSHKAGGPNRAGAQGPNLRKRAESHVTHHSPLALK